MKLYQIIVILIMLNYQCQNIDNEKIEHTVDISENEILLNKTTDEITNQKLNDSTLIVLESIEKEFLKNELSNIELLGKTYHQFSKYHFFTKNLLKSRKYSDKALFFYKKAYGEKHNNIAKVYYNKAMSYLMFYKEEYVIDISLEYLDLALSAIKEDDEDLFSIITNTIGEVYSLQGLFMIDMNELNKAEEKLKKAQKLVKNRISIISVKNNIGKIAASRGDYKSAIDTLNEVLILCDKYQINILDKYSYLTNLGRMYYLSNNLQYALDVLYVSHDSLMNYRVKTDNSPYSKSIVEQDSIRNTLLSNVYIHIGNTYEELNQFVEAQNNYNFSLMYAQIARSNKMIADAYHNLSLFYFEQNDLPNTFKYLNKSLKLNRKIRPITSPAIARNYGMIAKTLKKNNELEKALIYVDSTLYSIEYKEDDFSAVDDYVKLMATLGFKAEILFFLYEKTGKKNYLNLALKTGEEGDKAIIILKKRYPSLEYQKAWSNNVQTVYGYSTKATLNKYYQTNNRVYLEKAYEYTEKRKTAILLNASRDINAKAETNIDKILIHKELEYRKKIFFLKKQPYSTNIGQIQELQNLQDSLNQIINQYPEKYKKLKYDFSVLSIKEVQQELKPKQTVIEYTITKDSIYAFVITRKKMNLVTLGSADIIDNKIREYRQSFIKLEDKDNKKLLKNYQKYGYELYQQLFEPIEEYLDKDARLIIIPDKSLWFLPFETLLTKPMNDNKLHKNYSYLLRKYPISINYSASMWSEMLKNPIKDKTVRFAGFAPKFKKKKSTDDWNPLKYNIPEITTAAAFLGGKVFSEKMATKANFREAATKYNLLHLATHAAADSLNGENGFIVFQNGEGYDSLFAHELYTMPMYAHFVVLSACESGFGSLQDGEGLLSLARGFAYSGVKSIVMTGWNTDDNASEIIMNEMYANIKEGLTKDVALQKAKISYLENNHNHQPFYWGQFVLMGSTETLEVATFNWWILGFSITIFLIVGVLIKKWTR